MPNKKNPISTKLREQIAREFLPFILLPLVRRKILQREHLSDVPKLAKLVVRNVRIGTKEMRFCVSNADSFRDEAIKFWKNDERFMAIVLYATAVEHIINLMYQLIIASQGWTADQVTCLIRRVTIEDKLGWMFEAFTKARFPRPLALRLRTIFEIRNAIVHFKGVPAHLEGDDSFAKVSAQALRLRRMSIKRDFRLLEQVFADALLKTDPDRELVIAIAQAIFSQNDSTKSKSHP